MGEVILTLSDTPVEAWQGLLGALGGGLLTFIAVSRTNQSNQKQLRMQLEHTEKLQRQHHHRERLEELYSLVSHWGNAMVNGNSQMASLMNGNTKPSDYLAFANSLENKVDFNRLEMLVGIYGDSVQRTYNELMAARNDISITLSLCFDTYRAAGPNPALIPQLEAKEPKFTKAIKDLQLEIVKAAKEV